MSGKQKVIIGVTGGIGSGKSTICKILEKEGFPVYYADKAAKWVVNSNTALKLRIIDLLGAESYVDGAYNTVYVAGKVFEDQSLLQQLNDIIHPAVQEHFQDYCNNLKEDILFKESALIFETNTQNQYSEVIYVSSPKKLRIERIQKRDPQRSLEEIETIISKQSSEHKSVLLADFVINNDEEESILEQLEEIKDILFE